MNIPIILSSEEYLYWMDKYTPFVEDVFYYFNGSINPYNPCRLIVSSFDTVNYAGFVKPNFILVYLGSIINNVLYAYRDSDSMEDADKHIKSIIIRTMTHEMFHSNHDASLIKYGFNPSYAELVEAQVDYAAKEYLNAHRDKITARFGLDFYSYLDTDNNPVPKEGYHRFSYRDYYINTLMDVIFRNEDVRGALEEVFDKYDDFGLLLDGVIVIVKVAGEYSPLGLHTLNDTINKLYKNGSTGGSFSIKTHYTQITMKHELDNGKEAIDRDIICLAIETSNYLYTPVTFSHIE